MGKVDQVGVASMKRHDSCAAMFCVCYPLQQLWGLAAWIDHQHGLISRRGHEGVDAYCQMRRCPRGDRPAQQCRYEVYSPIPSSLLAEMRAEMPRLELRNADNEQIRRTVLTVTQGSGKQARLFSDLTQDSGPTS